MVKMLGLLVTAPDLVGSRVMPFKVQSGYCGRPLLSQE